ncbi:hypothetical protein JCM9279_005211 [Rhodotorula babjevae]
MSDSTSSRTTTHEKPSAAAVDDVEKQEGGGLDGGASTDEPDSALPADAKPVLPPGRLAPDDPLSPINWSTKKKILVDFVLNIWVLSLTYSSTAYVASVPALMRRFHSSQTIGLLGVTLTVLGFAAGPLLFGPSSEIYGRRPVYLGCGLLYSAFAFGVAFANDMPSLLSFRFAVGLFGSAQINNVPASIGDFTVPANRGPYSIIYAICAFGGPALGPLSSSFVETEAGYRWNLRVIAIFCTFTSLLAAFVPETHHPTLARHRAEKESSEPVARKSVADVVRVYKGALSRPFIFLFTEPIVAIISLYLSVLYGILYGFFPAFSVVWIEIRGFSQQSFGLTYIALGLGFLIGAMAIALLGGKSYMKAAKKALERGDASIPAEARLSTLTPIGAVLAPVSLFLFAWTAPFPSIHWAVPCLAELLFGCSMLMIFTSFIPYLIDSYQMHAASALAAGMASRALIGSVFPLFTLPMYHNLTVQGATSLFAGIACLCAPIPVIFARYGPGLRRRSRYAAANK